mmetsp:Transcript_12504/g.30367  ORF Transcript_12504/g.30367 Transcript_12504/m.30367 type:complete len:209 (-) Transcript_12504:4117-4743(-)
MPLPRYVLFSTVALSIPRAFMTSLKFSEQQCTSTSTSSGPGSPSTRGRKHRESRMPGRGTKTSYGPLCARTVSRSSCRSESPLSARTSLRANCEEARTAVSSWLSAAKIAAEVISTSSPSTSRGRSIRRTDSSGRSVIKTRTKLHSPVCAGLHVSPRLMACAPRVRTVRRHSSRGPRRISRSLSVASRPKVSLSDAGATHTRCVASSE